MTNFIKDALDEMSLNEIVDFQKELKAYISERKEEEKEKIQDVFHNTVEVGDKVKFIFKGEEAIAEVAKINDKTFSVEVENDIGNFVKKPIRFDKFIEKV